MGKWSSRSLVRAHMCPLTAGNCICIPGDTAVMGAFHGAEVPFVFGDQFEVCVRSLCFAFPRGS